MRRPIGVLILAALLAALVYSQRAYLVRTLADGMRTHIIDAELPAKPVLAGSRSEDTRRDTEAALTGIRRAQHLLADGELDSAATWLIRSQEADPQSPVAFRHLAVIRARQGRPGDALREMSMALERDSSNVWTWLQVGKLQAQLGDNESARRAWARAVSLDPGNRVARSLLEVTDQASGTRLEVTLPVVTGTDSANAGSVSERGGQ
jgi:Flp pilus assembly protein TadD